jgi:hypothetical protein
MCYSTVTNIGLDWAKPEAGMSVVGLLSPNQLPKPERGERHYSVDVGIILPSKDRESGWRVSTGYYSFNGQTWRETDRGDCEILAWFNVPVDTLVVKTPKQKMEDLVERLGETTYDEEVSPIYAAMVEVMKEL